MSFSAYTHKNIEAVLAEFDTTRQGLKITEAKKRFEKYGPNELSGRNIRWWQVFLRQFKSPFTYLLFFATALSFSLKEFTDGSIVLAFILINSFLGFIQEYHSEKSVKLLQNYLVPEATVFRNTDEIKIKSIELVPGDIIKLEAGDIIVADVRFIQTQSLLVDESILTGESKPAPKQAEALPKEIAEYHEASNIGFSGTKVMSGEALGVVIATGKNTAIGDISRLTTQTKPLSGFEEGIGKFSRFILIMISVILVILFGVHIIIKGSSTNIPELLLFSIALAVGVVPEALPLVTTIAFSRGALRLARHKVVIKRLSAIEDLGSIEILCTDKTGTLTENRLRVKEITAKNQEECLFFAALASASYSEKKQDANNSFDIAVLETLSNKEKKELKKYKKLSELPFDPERKRNSVLMDFKGKTMLIVRGAPEVLLTLCKITNEELNDSLVALREHGKQGERVLAVGIKEVSSKTTIYNQNMEKDLEFQGMISFVDPIKKTTREAIEEAQKLGVDVKVLTGDNKEVAGSVAKEINLIKNEEQVITGEELMKEPPEAQQRLVEEYHVFARVSPEQKYAIIALLREHKEVGYLGEGINDAPALKMAHVGIVVNGAAAIAKDAADIVLLQNSLLVIIQGIKEGREIFSNIIKYIKLTLISNFGNFYAVATAALILPYLPMLPIQLLLLNLLSDFPMIMISTDRVETKELRRPKTYNIREVILIALLLGIVSTIFDFIFFAVFRGNGPEHLQTYWFMGSVLTELILIFSIRSRSFFIFSKRASTSLIIVSIVAALLTILLPFTQFGTNVFKFTTPTWYSLSLVFGIVLAYFVVTESIKLLYYRFTNHSPLY